MPQQLCSRGISGELVSSQAQLSLPVTHSKCPAISPMLLHRGCVLARQQQPHSRPRECSSRTTSWNTLCGRQVCRGRSVQCRSVGSCWHHSSGITATGASATLATAKSVPSAASGCPRRGSCRLSEALRGSSEVSVCPQWTRRATHSSVAAAASSGSGAGSSGGSGGKGTSSQVAACSNQHWARMPCSSGGM